MEIGKLYSIKRDVTVYEHPSPGRQHTNFSTGLYHFILKKNDIVLCVKQLDCTYNYNFLYLFENKNFFLSYTTLSEYAIDLFLEKLK